MARCCAYVWFPGSLKTTIWCISLPAFVSLKSVQPGAAVAGRGRRRDVRPHRDLEREPRDVAALAPLLQQARALLVRVQKRGRRRRLLLEHLHDVLVNRAARHEVVEEDFLRLADAVDAV